MKRRAAPRPLFFNSHTPPRNPAPDIFPHRGTSRPCGINFFPRCGKNGRRKHGFFHSVELYFPHRGKVAIRLNQPRAKSPQMPDRPGKSASPPCAPPQRRRWSGPVAPQGNMDKIELIKYPHSLSQQRVTTLSSLLMNDSDHPTSPLPHPCIPAILRSNSWPLPVRLGQVKLFS